MTIQELKALSDNFDSICNKTWDMYGKLFPKTPYDYNENNLNFWSSILDCVSNESVKEAIFFIVSEYLYYHNKLGGIEVEFLEEIAAAYDDERCFVFPFKPGDYIATDKYSTPKQVVSVELYDANSYPVVHVEEKLLVEEVRTYKNTISYKDIKKFHVVDEPEMYTHVNETGEDFDKYWF